MICNGMQWYVVWYDVVCYNAVWYGEYGMAWYSVHDVVWYSVVPYVIWWYDMVQKSRMYSLEWHGMVSEIVYF